MSSRHKGKNEGVPPDCDATTDSHLALLLQKALPSTTIKETDKEPIPELQEIWQEAYDQVAKSEDKKLRSKVAKFETAIRIEYPAAAADGSGSNGSGSLVNDLASLNSTRRTNLMAKLTAQHGNESKGAKAVSRMPAAIAWAGICLVIAPLSNFAMASEDNKSGITYITERLPHNIDLIKHLRSKPLKSREETQEAKLSIRKDLVKLYRLIIEYQVLTFDSCHSKSARFKATLGSAKWKGMLDGIKFAEAQLDKDVVMYYQTQSLDKQDQLLETVKEKNRAEERNALIEVFNPKRSGFDYGAYEEYTKGLADPHSGTNQGTINSREFQAWLRTNEARLLLLLGNPGTGKSVFSKALEGAWLNQSPRPTICSFFFKDKSGGQNKVNVALCKILYILFKNRDNLIDSVQDTIKRLDKNDLRLNIDMLWNIFITATQSAAPNSIVVIFDALDEINQSQQADLLEKLQRFSNQAVKIFVTARPIHPFLDMFTPGPPQGEPSGIKFFLPSPMSILILENNFSLRDDIAKVANYRLEAFFERKKIRDQEIKDKLRQQFEPYIQNSRTYLFVELVFKYLDRLPMERNSKNWIQKLQSLPSTVYGTYTSLLETTPEEDKHNVKTMLQIMLAAQIPLELREMSIALRMAGIDEDNDFSDNDYTIARGLYNPVPAEDFGAWMLSSVQFFLVIYGQQIYFIHQTARDYLLSSGNDDQKPEWLADSFSEIACHKVMMKSCMKYISIPRELDMPLRSLGQLFDASESMQYEHFRCVLDSMEDDYSFGDYSFTKWFIHVNFVREKEDKKWPDMIDALKKQYPSISFDLAWFVFCCSALPSANEVRIFKETSLIDSMGGNDVDLALSCLSLSLVRRYLDIELYEDLSYAIDLEKEVIARSDPDDERLAQRLLNLSYNYLLQARNDDYSDTVAATSLSIEHADRAIKMFTRTHANQLRRAFDTLAQALNLRFDSERDGNDIIKAMNAIETALDPTLDPPTADEKHCLKEDHILCLTNIFRYFEFPKAAGENRDYEDQAIPTALATVNRFSQLHHSSPFERLMLLGNLLEEYAKRKPTKQHIDATIQAFHNAYEIIPANDPQRLRCLYSQALNLHFRYTCLGSKEDLSHAWNVSKTLYNLIVEVDFNFDPFKMDDWRSKCNNLRDVILRDIEKLKEEEPKVDNCQAESTGEGK